MDKLLQRLSRGEKAAYAEMFARYYDKVHRFLSGVLHGNAAAEDLAQNVFLKLWKNRRRLTEVRSFDSFLYTLSRNEALDWLRRHQVEKKHNVQPVHTPEPVYEMFMKHDSDLLRRTLDDVVANMPEQRRKVWLLSREEKLSHSEIADRLSISKRTVDRHLSLALEDIRSAISPIVS